MSKTQTRLVFALRWLLFVISPLGYAVPPTSQVMPPNPEAYRAWLANNGQVPPVMNQSLGVSANTAAPLPQAAAPKAVQPVQPAQPGSATPPASSVPPKKPQAALLVPEQDPNAPVIQVPMSYQDSQQVMLNTAPSSPSASADGEAAFNLLLQQNMPLTPQQQVKLRQLIDASQRAAAIPANVPPKPVSSTLMMNLAPGATPPAIRLAQGYVTSLVFVDSTGSPWPISSFDIGDPKRVTLQWDGKSNIVILQAISPYGDSDLVVRLAGLPTPITLELVAGQRVVDYRTDIHVPGIGPNAKDLPLGTGLPGSASQLLLNVLDGIAPPGSKPLTVTGGDCEAWILGDKMYLRSRLTVLSPGWVGRMVSPDGMHAYEIQKSSSVLVSQYGKPVELKVEGF